LSLRRIRRSGLRLLRLSEWLLSVLRISRCSLHWSCSGGAGLRLCCLCVLRVALRLGKWIGCGNVPAW
jgi:hypothetical protein